MTISKSSDGEPRASPLRRKGAGRPCIVCGRAERNEIDRALVMRAPLPQISANYGIATKSLARHRDHHIPTAPMAIALAERNEAEGQRGATLVQSAGELRDKALALLARAEAAGELKTALIGVREAARCLELMAKLTGLIDDSVQLNVVMAPALANLQGVLLEVLERHPAAKADVLAALAQLAGPSLPPLIEYRTVP